MPLCRSLSIQRWSEDTDSLSVITLQEVLRLQPDVDGFVKLLVPLMGALLVVAVPFSDVFITQRT